MARGAPDALTRAPRVSSPSDLESGAAGARIRVGGRIETLSRNRLVVRDAIRHLQIELTESVAGLQAGEIVVAEGTLQIDGSSPPRLIDAHLVERFAIAARHFEARLARLLPASRAEHLRQRATALDAVRAFFSQQGFLEVATPTRTQHPGTDAYIEPVPCQDGWLITSPESHMKQLLCAGLPRIYQIARCFRAEELGPLHQAEFDLVEWYRAFAGWEQILDDTEQLIEGVALAVRGEAILEHLGRRIDVTPPFERLTVRQAFRQHAGVEDAVELADRDEQRFFQILVDQVEPALARQSKPLVLHDYPRSQAALARVSPADPSVAERFEIYVAGVELCNGYGELTDPNQQRQRFDADVGRRRRAQQATLAPDAPLLRALEAGMPPAAGNALGFDRLVMLACGASSVGEVQAFPEPIDD